MVSCLLLSSSCSCQPSVESTAVNHSPPNLHTVHACRHYTLSPPQPVFTFTHPNWQQPADNAQIVCIHLAAHLSEHKPNAMIAACRFSALPVTALQYSTSNRTLFMRAGTTRCRRLSLCSPSHTPTGSSLQTTTGQPRCASPVQQKMAWVCCMALQDTLSQCCTQVSAACADDNG
jgi:hypothetical protein